MRFDLLLEARPAADAVDGLVACSLDDPCARNLRNSGNRPLFDGGRKCLLGGFLSQIEIVEKPDQSGDDPPPIGTIDFIDRCTGIREQLGGYFLVEAKDLDEAIAIAGRIPGARMGTVEVRPVMEIPDLPEAQTDRKNARARAEPGLV